MMAPKRTSQRYPQSYGNLALADETIEFLPAIRLHVPLCFAWSVAFLMRTQQLTRFPLQPDCLSELGCRSCCGALSRS